MKLVLSEINMQRSIVQVSTSTCAFSWFLIDSLFFFFFFFKEFDNNDRLRLENLRETLQDIIFLFTS